MSKSEQKPKELTLLSPLSPQAYDYDSLPDDIRECVAAKIEKDFNLWNTNPYSDRDYNAVIKSIFKVLVARDCVIKLSYVRKRVLVNDQFHTELQRVWDDSTFTWVSRNEKFLDFPAGTAFYTAQHWDVCGKHVFNANAHEYEHGSYRSLSDRFYDRGDDTTHVLNEELEKCNRSNRELIRHVLYHSDSKNFNDAWSKKINEIEALDQFTPSTVTITKAEWMSSPIEKSEYSQYIDHDVLNVIKKYNLSTEVNQKFIDWITNGCIDVDGIANAKLSAENAGKLKCKPAYGDGSRGDIVASYHGFDEDVFEKLRVGSVFSAGASKYVVFDVGDDEGTKLIGYAKLGTKIDEHGILDKDNIMLGCEAGIIESCWDALFEVNRVGKRKKILKNVKIIKA